MFRRRHGLPPVTDPNYVLVHPNGQVLFTADTVADQVSRLPSTQMEHSQPPRRFLSR